jgi:hypothetical protein
MIRCSEGHFYDPGKHNACPWCGVAAQGQSQAETLPLRPVDRPAPTPAAAPTPGTGPASTPVRAPDYGATKALHREASGLRPVVGWLVCIEGPDRGQDYRIHMEKNFIGRSNTMDIAIMGDESISREKHATVTFDPKKSVFWLLPGDSSGLVYLNESLVNAPTELKADDVIELGNTKLVLVPFGRQW